MARSLRGPAAARPLTFAIAATTLLPPALVAADPLPSTQEPTAAPAPPAEPQAPLLQLRVAGPAVWRTQFAPTNVGSLLASESGRALWSSTVAPLEEGLRRQLGLDEERYAGLRTRWLDYGGELEISVWMRSPDGIPDVLLRLLPDGGSDLDALGADLSMALQRLCGKGWQPAEGAGNAMLLAAGDVLLAEPRRSGECLVAAVGARRDLAAVLQRTAAMPIPSAAELQRPRPPLSLHFHTADAVARFGAGDPDAPLWRALGVASLGELSLQLGTAGPHVQLELAHTFRGDDRGLFGVLFPQGRTLPAIAALLPAPDQVRAGATHSPGGWKLGHLDLPQLYEPIVRLVAARDDDPAAARAHVEEWLGGATDGFLAQFTGEYLLYGADQIDVDEGVRDWALALRCRDTDAVGRLWRTVRRELGMTELRSDDLGQGWQLHHQSGFFAVDVLIGPQVFALAYGPNAGDRLRDLAEAGKKIDWSKPAVVPPQLRAVQRYAPPGWNGGGEADVAALFAQVGTSLAAVSALAGHLPMLDLAASVDAEQRDRMAALLDEHHLRTARSLTGCADGRWCFRVLW